MASAWYAEHGLFEEAADQAFLAGDAAQAVALVERSAQRMTVQGRSTAVFAWYRRLSPKDLEERPGFWGPAAWALAMSDRHDEALPLVDLILSQPNLDPAVGFEAALIGATASAFADRPEQMSAAPRALAGITGASAAGCRAHLLDRAINPGVVSRQARASPAAADTHQQARHPAGVLTGVIRICRLRHGLELALGRPGGTCRASACGRR